MGYSLWIEGLQSFDIHVECKCQVLRQMDLSQRRKVREERGRGFVSAVAINSNMRDVIIQAAERKIDKHVSLLSSTDLLSASLSLTYIYLHIHISIDTLSKYSVCQHAKTRISVSLEDDARV